jgi:TetR/AcrR family transcriptional regulator, transcriptional repressor of bet genes
MSKVIDVPGLAKPAAREKMFERLPIVRFVDNTDTREKQILVGAFCCIRDVGIAATTTRAVATRANLNQGAIHYYFRSKDQLLLGLLGALMGNSKGILEAIRDADLAPVQKLYCVLRSGANFVRSDELLVLVSLWAHAYAKGGAWRATYKQAFTALRAVLIEIIDEGIEAGEFQKTDSKTLAETILTSVQGIGMHYKMVPQDFAGQDLGERLFALFSHMVVAP